MAAKKIKLEVNDSYCKRCGICAAYCSKKVFDLAKDGLPVVSRLGECNGCRLCEKRCPDFAIELEVVINA